MSTSEPRIPARFDPSPWDEDLAHSTPAGRTAAHNARRAYEPDGIPRSRLKPCEAEGRDGTRLPYCFKVYVTHPDGPWGVVFKTVLVDCRLHMDFLAFGLRHPTGPGALSVYEVADRRLNA